MKRSIWALLPVFSLFIPLLGQAQANEESDPLLRVIELTSQVHFDDASGAPVVVPAGDYWVNAAGNTLTLAALDGASNFALKATAGTHDNELDAVTALVYDAGEELPDTVFIALMSPDGQQVVAQGSLSGVQQRGVLSDAKKKAAAAAAAAAAARKRALDKARQVAAAALVADINTPRVSRFHGRPGAAIPAQRSITGLPSDITARAQPPPSSWSSDASRYCFTGSKPAATVPSTFIVTPCFVSRCDRSATA